ncbi:hypothetical protein TCAL_11175 [Tigriopus californicus]|uniref:RING-CH-type domain-containing protein n=1 Tax=Tigriopus californicus TaxID=6832 RepID=A0A553NC73_TIGCA|nr:uncharacterized protein LOC131889572 isoform X2 [Tigriopus californicus]TRY62998.1 hypothetical protein TCAL_11175 [Tigriopus californicus]
MDLSMVEVSLGALFKAANHLRARLFGGDPRDRLDSSYHRYKGGMADSTDQNDTTPAVPCPGGCSNHGECFNGTCLCQIQFEGTDCSRINFSYHVAFASIFFLLSLTSLVQLVMCIHAEYLRMKKHPSILKACRVTTQKLLYFLVFAASLIRGAYFASPTISSQLSISLLSAYYPLVLTGSSLIVCFWAEVFHLQQIRWDRPRFLSKSFLGFLVFNLISYSLFIAELVLVWVDHDDREFYTHIFNGCYAGLMFIVVIFFLIYGVEVFFKVRGGFTLSKVPGVISSNRAPIIKRQMSRPLMGETNNDNVVNTNRSCEVQEQAHVPKSPSRTIEAIDNAINTSQLHQSRLGLLSQALMMIITCGFLFSETLEQFWKTKVDLQSRNTHDIIFRTVEIGVALWFPCVLWNCIRPDQLWCLNPKKILERFPPNARHHVNSHGLGTGSDRVEGDLNNSDEDDDEENEGPECWICYDNDRVDAGQMINPCNCRGDVGAVHHDCLRRWLVESADNPDALRCKVCNVDYKVEKGSQFSLTQGFTPRHWIQTLSIVTLMTLSIAGSWTVIQLYSEPWAKMLAVGSALLIQYICLRFLGLNTLTAYQRAKVSALKIVSLNKRRRRQNRQQTIIASLTLTSPGAGNPPLPGTPSTLVSTRVSEQ